MNDAFEVIGARLLVNAADTLQAWLPKGRRQGREWCVGSLSGEPGQSLKINIDSGRWQDFATGVKGGDLVSLYAALHGLNQVDALKRLGGESDAPLARLSAPSTAPEPAPEAVETLERPPASAPTAFAYFKHPRHGFPAQVYLYKDTAGALLHAVARYEGADGKAFAPFTWAEGRWRMKGAPRPRPLYGLPRLANLPRRVVVVEGEKAADALQAHIQKSPIVTWSGGANNWRYADWTPLAGRAVLLWPDADPPGVAAAQGIAGVLLGLGCTVERVDVDGLPDGHDAADLIASGVEGVAIGAWLKPRMRVVTMIQEEPKEPERVAEPAPVAAPERPRRSPAREYEFANDYGLAIGRSGVLNSLSNVNLLLTGLIDNGTLPAIWFDEFLQRRLSNSGEWTEQDDEDLLLYFQRNCSLHQFTRDNVRMAASTFARAHRRNCVVDWMRKLQWDGVKRLTEFLPEAFGTPRNDYAMAVGRCFIMGMVARALQPGCQVDNLPVFEGPQGARKSQALRILGGEWHAEVHEDIRSKDFYLCLAGKLLIEISELQSFRRQDIEMIKAVITSPKDRFRAPFERSSIDHPRQSAFVATTNSYRWNVDPTGARRFWPVRCGLIDLEYIRKNREQLFAEAVRYIDEGRPWWDVPEELAREEQSKRYNLDSIEQPIVQYLQGLTFVTLTSILESGLGLERAQKYDSAITGRVIALLTRRGWQESEYVDRDSRQTYKGWAPPDEPIESEE